MGLRDGGSTGGRWRPTDFWLWLGGWVGHGLAHGPTDRSHRYSLHAATAGLTGATARLHRLLGGGPGRARLSARHRIAARSRAGQNVDDPGGWCDTGSLLRREPRR